MIRPGRPTPRATARLGRLRSRQRRVPQHADPVHVLLRRLTLDAHVMVRSFRRFGEQLGDFGTFLNRAYDPMVERYRQ